MFRTASLLCAGWDCHGLPIELKALESLQEAAKKKSRKSRQGVDTGKLKAAAGLARTMEPLAVRELAREWALRAVREQMQDFKRWGVMADWEGGDDAAGVYTTLSPAYEAAQLEVLAQLVEGGHVFQGEKPVHWSPAAQSALAEAELEYVDDYTSTALHVRFPLHLASCSGQVQDLAAAATAAAGQGCPPIAAAAWTTTPWTIPASRALAVNPAAAYTAVVVEMPGGQRYPLLAAAELAERVASDIGGELVWRSAQHVEGSQLVGAQVQHPLAAWDAGQYGTLRQPIIPGDYVTMDAGTGIVHTAPGHGHDDFDAVGAWNAEHGAGAPIPVVCPVAGDGSFTHEAGSRLEGRDIHEAVPDIVQALSGEGVLLAANPYQHRYPHDWRTKSPVIIRVTPQWFADLSGLVGPAVQALSVDEEGPSQGKPGVDMVPPAGRARLLAAVKGRSRWCISRQRVWGVPIPAWTLTDTGEALPLTSAMVRHVAEVVQGHPRGTDAWWELGAEELLPRSVLDDLGDRVQCLEKGQDTLDVWFDSGCSWRAGWVDGADPPDVADAVLEGSDQHRGWFQSSLLTSVAAQGRAPYKTVITHGFVLDGNGRKMSKSLGNTIVPPDIIDGRPPRKGKKKGSGEDFTTPYGADVTRMWVGSADFTRDVSLSPTVVTKAADAVRKVRNTARFLLAATQGYTPPAAMCAVAPQLSMDAALALQHEDVARGFADAPRGLLRDAVEAAWSAPTWSCAPLPASPADLFALSRVKHLHAAAHEALQAFSTPKHNAELMAFASTDLSALYFDFVKDTLYCGAPGSPQHVAAQAACWEALKALTIAAAPVLPYTAEDIFLHANAQLLRGAAPATDAITVQGAADVVGATVFDMPWWQGGTEGLAAALPSGNTWHSVDSKWAGVLKVREVAMAALEKARAAGHLGKALEGRLVLAVRQGSTASKGLQWLAGTAGALENAFGVSQVGVVEVPDAVAPQVVQTVQRALQAAESGGPPAALHAGGVDVQLSPSGEPPAWAHAADAVVSYAGESQDECDQVLAIVVPGTGQRCARCWKLDEGVAVALAKTGKGAEPVPFDAASVHSHLCPRCSAVVAGML